MQGLLGLPATPPAQAPAPPLVIAAACREPRAVIAFWRSLAAVAALETTHRKAPCKYLGAKINEMKYEPDPAKWPVQCYPISQGKTKATVYFEWEHVLRAESPRPPA